MCCHKTESMIILILLWHRISIFPMNIHKNRLDNHSSMSMIKHLFNLLRSSNSDSLLSLSKIKPFIFKLILHFTRNISNCLVVNILVVNISSRRTPSTQLWYSNWNCRNTVRHQTEFSWSNFVGFSQKNDLKVIKNTRNDTSQVRIVCKDRTTGSCVLSSNHPSVGSSSLYGSCKVRQMYRSNGHVFV